MLFCRNKVQFGPYPCLGTELVLCHRALGSAPCLHMRQRGFGLGQPEGHGHGAVEVDGGGQGDAGLLPLAGRGIQRAEATVTMGYKRAHAQCLSQGQGLTVVGCGRLDLRRLAPRRNLAEEAQGIRLESSLLVRTGECQGPLNEGVPLFEAAGQHLRFPQAEKTRRLTTDTSQGTPLFYRLREERYGVSDPPGQRIRRTQGPSYSDKLNLEARVLIEAHRPFEHGE